MARIVTTILLKPETFKIARETCNNKKISLSSVINKLLENWNSENENEQLD